MRKRKMLSKLIVCTVALTLTLPVGNAFAKSSNPSASQAPTPTARKSLDKTPFLNKLKAEDQITGYSEFYKHANPHNKGFAEKFKAFATKLDKLNNAKGIKSKFNLNKILNSKDIIHDTSIDFGSGSSGSTTQYQNYFDPSTTYTGDILLVNDPGYHIQGSIQHAQMMDKYNYLDYNSLCELTAEPNEGVIFETPNQTRGYYQVYVTYVKAAYPQYIADGATFSAEQYLGRTYLWASDKSTNTYWYCSKVPYRGYLDYAGIDIDADGGYWVLPEDILNSSEVALSDYYLGYQI